MITEWTILSLPFAMWTGKTELSTKSVSQHAFKTLWSSSFWIPSILRRIVVFVVVLGFTTLATWGSVTTIQPTCNASDATQECALARQTGYLGVIGGKIQTLSVTFTLRTSLKYVRGLSNRRSGDIPTGRPAMFYFCIFTWYLCPLWIYMNSE